MISYLRREVERCEAEVTRIEAGGFTVDGVLCDNLRRQIDALEVELEAAQEGRLEFNDAKADLAAAWKELATAEKNACA